jgi:hypothetical protein
VSDAGDIPASVARELGQLSATVSTLSTEVQTIRRLRHELGNALQAAALVPERLEELSRAHRVLADQVSAILVRLARDETAREVLRETQAVAGTWVRWAVPIALGALSSVLTWITATVVAGRVGGHP